MRIISLVFVLSLLPPVFAQEENTKNRWQNTPKTLAQAHAELERVLSAETLAEIDAMESEKDMIKYHFGIGMGIRNSWGLWGNSPLAQHMRDLGFTHPDSMSGVILATFWCHRHKQEFHLKERLAEARRSSKERPGPSISDKALETIQETLTENMMRLQFDDQNVSFVNMPKPQWGVNTRFVCNFRHGVFISGYALGESIDDFRIAGYFLDTMDKKIHSIRIPEIQEVSSAVVVSKRAWFAGMTAAGPVLVGVSDQDRLTVPLPQTNAAPTLGIDGQSLLAVYSKTIYQLVDGQWRLVHSGDILLPRSGVPPRKYGDTVFFVDEGTDLRFGDLWWLTMGERPRLTNLADDAKQAGLERAFTYDPSSYCVAGHEDLWSCGGEGSLVRRSKDGTYSIAMLKGPIGLARDGVFLSSVTTQADGTLLLAGLNGVYQLTNNKLIQKLFFVYEGAYFLRATSILLLDDGSYFISGDTWSTPVLLCPGDNGWWKSIRLNSGDPVVW